MSIPLADITDEVLVALAARPDVLQAFGALFSNFLACDRKFLNTCRRCVAFPRVKAARATALEQLKQAVVALPPEQRDHFKRLVGADKIRVVAGVTHTGTSVRHVL